MGSSRPAWAVVGLVAPATKSLVIDMAVVLEGHTEDELPEHLLGTVRFSKIDMRDCPFLDIETGTLHPKSAGTPRSPSIASRASYARAQ